MIKKITSMSFILAAMLLACAVPASAQMTAEDIVSEIYQRFMDQGFKSVIYDEVRVVSQEASNESEKGMMPLNQANATTMKLRYFYKAPDQHAYKLISEEIENYWVGSPNQIGALPVDRNWKDKVLSWYAVTKADKTQKLNGHEVYLVTLMPKPGMPAAYPMTWYVDTERFVVLKFIFLVETSGRSVHSMGELTYEKQGDYWMPATAEWRTKVSGLPFVFRSSSVFSNHKFNEEIDDSVFTEEFPDNWFEKVGISDYHKDFEDSK